MLEIWFEAHAQTHHNVAGLASGHYDVALTDYGRQQAGSILRRRYADHDFNVGYTSDTQRAYDTACLIFEGRTIPIMRDARLRECDYGDFEGRPRAEMEAARRAAIHTPFHNGESYQQVAVRMHHFLEHLAAERDGQRVMLVGHAATLWMLEHWLLGRALEEVVGRLPERPWRFTLEPKEWQPSTRLINGSSAAER